MGFGDFLGGVGEAIGGDFVVDQIKKAPQAAQNVVDAGTQAVKGASHLITNPTQVARGIGAAAQFVEDNPGKVWDTGFEVGRAVVKDQLDPVNLAINAGLIGLTVATGGAAAPALIGKLATGARTAKVGLEAARAGESAIGAMRTARTINTAMRATRTVEAASDVAQTARTVNRLDRALGGVDAAGDATRMNRLMNPVSRRVENFVQPLRNRAAEKVLAGGGGETAGLGRQVVAAAVQGNTGAMPVQLARQSERVADLNKTMWRGRQIAAKTVGRVQTAQTAQTAYDIAYDPVGAATQVGESAWAEHGDEITARASPYVDQARQAQDALKAEPEKPKEIERREPEQGQALPSAEQAMGLQQFRLDRTHATRATRRRPNQPGELGVVSDDTTPMQIGPKDWYGPQGGYDAGRGFRQRPLEPLTQPKREVLGV